MSSDWEIVVKRTADSGNAHDNSIHNTEETVPPAVMSPSEEDDLGPGCERTCLHLSGSDGIV